MSGGSFNYLTYKMSELDILQSSTDLDAMLEYLDHQQGREMVEARLKLHDYKRKRELALSLIEELLINDYQAQRIAKTIEWLVSCDIGEEGAKQQIRQILNLGDDENSSDDIPF